MTLPSGFLSRWRTCAGAMPVLLGLGCVHTEDLLQRGLTHTVLGH
jgi:hypothetical protein